MTTQGFHEPIELLSQETMDRHRAILSLMEELEAVDWYSQRLEATHDSELKAILKHNRDEEVEHAVMVLEWLRRNDPVFGRELGERLFKDGPIAVDAGDAEGGGEGAPGGGLGIGDLKGSSGPEVE